MRAPEVVADTSPPTARASGCCASTGGNCVETVFIPEDERGTLCVSSQVGCALDCAFCSTGKQGFHRNLTAAEIIGQVWLANRALLPTASAQGRRPPHHQRGDDGHGRAAGELRQRRCRDGPDAGRLRLRDVPAPRDAEHGRRRARDRPAGRGQRGVARGLAARAERRAARPAGADQPPVPDRRSCSTPPRATSTRRPRASSRWSTCCSRASTTASHRRASSRPAARHAVQDQPDSLQPVPGVAVRDRAAAPRARFRDVLMRRRRA